MRPTRAPILTGVTSQLSLRAFGPLRGGPVFMLLSFVACLFCHLEGLLKTSDCLSSEKRDGTLGLLFLTDLRGYDIVLGKLTSTSLQSFYGLLAILPLLGLPILMGGVTGQQFWRVVLALIAILFFSLATGMLASSVCRERQKSANLTTLIFLAFNLVPLFTPLPAIKLFSPMMLLNGVFNGTKFAAPADYFASLALIALLGVLALVGASLAVPRFWQEGEAHGLRGRRPREWTPAQLAQRAEIRREQLNTNPMLWLASRYSTRMVWLWLLALPVALLIVGVSLVGGVNVFATATAGAWAINLVLLGRLAAQAPRCLNEARRNGSLELLLTTPLGIDQILSGQRLALQRAFLPVMLTVFILEGLAALLMSGSELGVMVVFSFSAGFYLLQCFAITNAGIWFGLTSRNESAATNKLVLLVLLSPMLCMPFCILGIPFMIGIPLFWSAYASTKIRAELRNQATRPVS